MTDPTTGEHRESDIKHVVRGVLGGDWEGVSPGEILLSPVGGGITNILFKAQGPSEISPVLVRIYGDGTDMLIDRERDNHLFHELSTLGFAPPYLGRFGNGRIEGYLPARPLEPHEMALRSPVDFVTLIAREMARMHVLPMTTAGPRKEVEVFGVITKWLALAKGLRFEDELKAKAVASLDLAWVGAQAAWAEQQLRTKANPHCRGRGFAADGAPEAQVPVGSTAGSNGSAEHSSNGSNGSRVHYPEHDRGRLEEKDPADPEAFAKQYLAEVVMSHNDMLSGNVLHASGWDRVQVIDYEYSGYNPRGFDMANHFLEHAGFDSDFSKSYPTHETQTTFLRAYLKEAFSREGDTGAVCRDDDDAFVAALREEVDRWTLPSHLFWAIWAVVQACYSPIDFDFLGYARLRLDGYKLHKEAFFGEQRELEGDGQVLLSHEADLEPSGD